MNSRNGRTTKVGLLGAGYIFDAHAKALSAIDNVALSAVCDTSLGKAKSAAARYGIPLACATIKELAASDCDAVHILLPPSLHIDTARTLIEAGKDVFIEKPMGLARQDCDALCALAKERGVRLGVNHNFLFTRSYEDLRSRLKNGEMGRIQQLAVNWHFALPQLQFGPFDNWMLGAPSNVLFELGSHLAAFVVDLVGEPEIKSAIAARAVELPGGLKAFKSWNAFGVSQDADVQFSLSISSGHADRFIRVRCRGETAHLDFGRDIGWYDRSVSDNPIFESYHISRSAGAVLTRIARHDRLRRIKSALRKRPDATPFDESIYRSIHAFYSGKDGFVDPRHTGDFAARVIGVCEAVAEQASTGRPSDSGFRAVLPSSQQSPDVLVVGGTGFIGRRLVRKLCESGRRVRVLSRNVNSAAMDLGDLNVELMQGSHGNRADAERALQGIEAVYHLAKCDGKRWLDYVRGDIEPTRVLAEAAVAAGVKRFIYTGTIASYASGDSRARIDNTTPVDPGIERRGHYARSKAACEALLQELDKEKGLGLTIVRPGIVIGPGSPPAHLGVGNFLNETRVQFWGKGDHPLPFILAEDVADALALCLARPGVVGQTLLLTSPPLLTASEYVNEVGLSMGSRISVSPRSAFSYWVAEGVKEAAKNLVRHPNRRWPTLHDIRCREHVSRFDGTMTEELLQWQPVRDRNALIRRGIHEAVAWFTK